MNQRELARAERPGSGKLPAPKTYEEAIAAIIACPSWAWTARWWRCSELIVELPDRPKDRAVMAVKDAAAPLPRGILALGCTGLNVHGQFDWLGWDFDVGDHGAASYPSLKAATASALGLWHYLDENAEVRFSKSGNGVHVRTLLPQAISKDQGISLAKAAVDALGLKADRTPIGRQQFWLWVRNRPNANSFKLIKQSRVTETA